MNKKKEEYKDDEELSKFLMSDKSDEYKSLIISLLETDYNRFTYGQRNDNYRETHKEVIRRYKTEYRKLNEDVIKQRQADYCKDYYKSNKEAIKQQCADYRKSNKDAIKQYIDNYYKSNKEAILKRQADYRKLIKQNKVHYCKLCDKSFGCNFDLQRHFKSKGHLRNKSRT